MRWAWLITRHVRRSLHQKHISLTTAPLPPQPCPAHHLVQRTGLQHFATQQKPQTRFQLLSNPSRHPEPHPPDEPGVNKRGKVLVNTPEHTEAFERWKAKGNADVRQGDTPEHADSAKLRKAAGFVKTTEPGPFDVAQVTEGEKLEYVDASDPRAIPKDPHIQPAGHALACRTYHPPQQPLAATSCTSTGFSIDGHGQLQIRSTTAALKKSRIALIVSSVSRNLVEADFTRLLAHASDRSSDQGGFMRAIPGRDTDFHRLSYWILLFDCPYNAASFQHRLRWYHANASLNRPVDPYTAATTKNRELTPPESYIDPLSGEDIWKRLHEFSLLLPTQSFNVTALLEPFPQTVSTDLRNHELWRFPTTKCQAWPVRIWIDRCYLDASLAKRFLEDDGTKRGHKWKLVEGSESVEPMFYTAFNSKGDRINREGEQLSKQGVALLCASPQKNWLIRFRAEEDALLFWRTWHRTPFPKSLSPSPGEELLLHVDRLW